MSVEESVKDLGIPPDSEAFDEVRLFPHALDLNRIFGEALAQPGLSSILEKDKKETEPEVGFVQSVNYPSCYPNNFDDETELQVEDGSVMEFKFEAFDLEPDSIGQCRFDYFAISETSGNGVFKKLCGNDLAASTRLTSIGNDLTLRFSTGKFPAIVVSMKAVSEHPGGR